MEFEMEFETKMEPGLREKCAECRSYLSSAIEDSGAGDIYHYTSAEGFHNIISNRQFFLTDVAFLNDSTEMANIINIFRDVLFGLCGRIPEDLHSALEPLLNVDDFGRMMFGSEQPDHMRHFVLACSYEADSLSLWNYYAQSQDKDAGYNIAFSREKLIDSFWRLNDDCYGGDMALSHGRVIYDERRKKELIAQYILKLAGFWDTVCGQQRCLLLSAVKSTLEWLSIFYKHQCFEAEREYRVLLSLPNRRLTGYFKDRAGEPERLYKIRFTNNMFTPYVKLDFCPEDMKGVCMSPLCEKYTTEYKMRGDFELSGASAGLRDVLQYGVHEFLRVNGYHLSADQIRRSEIPLRF